MKTVSTTLAAIGIPSSREPIFLHSTHSVTDDMQFDTQIPKRYATQISVRWRGDAIVFNTQPNRPAAATLGILQAALLSSTAEAPAVVFQAGITT